MTRTRWIAAALGLALALTQCVHEPAAPSPDEMTAAEHRREAATLEREAAEEAALYDPGASMAAARDGDSFSIANGTYNPTDAHRRRAELLNEHAAGHRAAARALERFESEECATFEPHVRAACPLLAPLASVENVADGVRLHFREDAPVVDILAHVRCHLAFAATHDVGDLESCPLYIEGLRANAGPDASSIDLVTASRPGRSELRARMARLAR